MTAEHFPARRRFVGGVLRSARENLGLDLDDAARVLECDPSKISRIETGQRGMRGKEVRELLGEFGLDEHVQQALSDISDPRGPAAWWKPLACHLPPAAADGLALASQASSITVFEAQRIPEPLQTPEYAAVLAEGNPSLTNDEAREAAARAVAGLQQAWARNGTEIHVVLSEAALHQQIGGPDVIEPQLDRLREAASDSGRISIQVLPFWVREHPAPWSGSLSLMCFAGSPDLSVVLIGDTLGGVVLDAPSDSGAHARILDRVALLALPPAASAIALRDLEIAEAGRNLQTF